MVGGVLELDDPLQHLALHHEAPVAARIGRFEPQHDDIMAGPRLGHAFERFGADEGRIAIKHDHVARCPLERPAGAEHRVAGAKLFGLDHHLCRVIEGLRRGGDRIGPHAGDDDGAFGGKRGTGFHRVDQKRRASHRMQHLWQIGVHARALPGGEDNQVGAHQRFSC